MGTPTVIYRSFQALEKKEAGILKDVQWMIHQITEPPHEIRTGIKFALDLLGESFPETEVLYDSTPIMEREVRFGYDT